MHIINMINVPGRLRRNFPASTFAGNTLCGAMAISKGKTGSRSEQLPFGQGIVFGDEHRQYATGCPCVKSNALLRFEPGDSDDLGDGLRFGMFLLLRLGRAGQKVKAA